MAYIVCKDCGTQRSIYELQDVIGDTDRKNIAYYNKFLLRDMEIHIPLPVPSNSISRIADRTHLSEKTVRKALKIVNLVKDNALLSGKNPVSSVAEAPILRQLRQLNNILLGLELQYLRM